MTVVDVASGVARWSGSVPLSLLKSGTHVLTLNGFVAADPASRRGGSAGIVGVSLHGELLWRRTTSVNASLMMVDGGVVQLDMAPGTGGEMTTTVSLIG